MGGDGCGEVEKVPRGIHADITPDIDDGYPKYRPWVDECPKPLKDPILELLEKLPRWPEPRVVVGEVGIRKSYPSA